MTEKIFKNPRLRLPRRIKKGSIIEVRVKVNHNSSTGLKFSDGKYSSASPAYYLMVMKVYYGEDLLCSYDMTAATSPNPLIRFKMKATKEAPVKVVFTNSDYVKKEVVSDLKFA